MKEEIVVCEYVDARVVGYLEDNPVKKVVTLYKEPFCKYGGSTVVFIDDLLCESDYQKIDEHAEVTLSQVRRVFSKYLTVEGYEFFNYYQLLVKRLLPEIYKYKYAVDQVIRDHKITNLVLVNLRQDMFQWLKEDYGSEVIQIAGIDGRKTKSELWMRIRSSGFVHLLIDSLFKDRRTGLRNILWLGERCDQSRLFDDLKRDFGFLLINGEVRRRTFIKNMRRYCVLGIKDRRGFAESWHLLEQAYEKGLEELEHILGLKPELLEIILKFGRKELLRLLSTLYLLKDNRGKLDLLLVFQSVNSSQGLAAEYFERHSLPSLEVVHGIPSGDYEVQNTIRVAVYGQRDKLRFMSSGVDEDRISVTGCPYYDKFFEIEQSEKKFEFLLLALDHVEFRSSRASYKMIFEQVESMAKLLQVLPKERLIIKLHPRQTEKERRYVQHLIETMGIEGRVRVRKNVDLTSLLKKAKIVFTYTSSVGVEALLMCKLLVVLDFFGNRGIEYEKFGGCVVVRDFEELKEQVKGILINLDEYTERMKNNIERTRSYFSTDLTGRSYKNVAALIRQMVL